MIAGFALAAVVALPLGPAGLKERRTTKAVADGVQLTRIVRGPFRVAVLTVDPSRRLGVLTGHDRVPGLEPLSAMARRHKAIAGINGGFFATGAPDTGDPTGILVANGTLLSEPVGARTAFVIPKAGPARIEAVRWKGRVIAGGRTRILDGVNRNQGRIPACGGVGGDQPTQRIDTALTCTDASELVLSTPGHDTPKGTYALAIGGGSRLSGTGDAARFLKRIAPGDRVEVDTGVDADAVVGGAPRLVRDGRVALPKGLEGRAGDTGRVARTVAGIRADGTILLLVIDRAGATLTEAARVARSLGAEDALGLDSGGSTTMTVGTRVVNRPSDGERAVADGLFILADR